MERKILERTSVPYRAIPAGKFRRYFSLQNFIDPFKVFGGFLCSLVLLLRYRPRLLFSKGGFVSVPPVFAAKLLGIPVLIHESDMTPGLANRLTTGAADLILLSFEDTRAHFSSRLREKVRITGHPVRGIFARGNPEEGRKFLFPNQPDSDRSLPILLVLGGSQGSREMNDLLRKHLKELTEFALVVHQTGERDFRPPSGDSADSPEEFSSGRYHAAPYFHAELPSVLAASSLVFCRSGAGTLWELSLSGTPGLFLPLGKSSSRGEQILNARYFEKREAGLCLADKKNFLPFLKSLLTNQKKLDIMRDGMLRLSRENAAEKIADLLKQSFESPKKHSRPGIRKKPPGKEADSS